MFIRVHLFINHFCKHFLHHSKLIKYKYENVYNLIFKVTPFDHLNGSQQIKIYHNSLQVSNCLAKAVLSGNTIQGKFNFLTDSPKELSHETCCILLRRRYRNNLTAENLLLFPLL